jgi:hypothetical protein
VRLTLITTNNNNHTYTHVRYMSPDIEAAVDLIRTGKVLEAAMGPDCDPTMWGGHVGPHY